MSDILTVTVIQLRDQDGWTEEKEDRISVTFIENVELESEVQVPLKCAPTKMSAYK